MLRTLWRQIWLTIVVALVMLALYSSVGRQLMPLAENYQQELEQWLSEQLQQPVSIGALQGSWTGLSPVVKIENLQAGGEQGIYFALIEADLSISATLFYRQPVFHSIRIQGSRGSLTQIDSRHWQITPNWIVETPEKEKTSSSNEPTWLGWLSLQKSIRLDSLELKLQRLQQDLETFKLERVRWRSLGRHHELKADLLLGQESFSKIRLQASLVGSLWPLQAQDGHLYVELEHQDWAQWFNLDANSPLSIARLEGSAQGWLSINRGTLEAVYIEAKVDGVELHHEQEPFKLGAGQLILAGAHQGDDWHLQIQPQFKQNLPFKRIGLSQLKLGRQTVWQATIPELDIGETQNFLEEYQLLPEKIAFFIDGTAPRGEAQNIRFTAMQEVQSKEFKFDLQALVKDVHSSAFHGIPAISGADARLRIQKNAGLVELNEANLGLHLADLYTPSWQIEQLNGKFRWLIHPNHGQLLLEDTHAFIRDPEGSQEHWPVSASMQILLPLHGQPIEPSLSLLLGVEQGPINLQRQLVPDLVGDATQHWLNQSLQAGSVHAAAFALQMALHKEHILNDASSQLFLNFSEAQLQYLPDWPEVRNLAGTLYLDSPLMEVKIDQGETLGGQIKAQSSYAKLEIGERKAHLQVGASLQGESAEALKYFTETPLADLVGHALDDWQLDGRQQTDFLLRLNLAAEEIEPEIWLTSYIANNHLRLPELQLDIAQLEGAISYSSFTGLSAKRISADLLGGHYEGAIHSDLDEDSLTINLLGAGKAQWQAIKAWQPIFVLEPVSGEFDYNAKLRIDSQGVGLEVNSDLAGTAVDLPNPLGKEQDSKTPLNIAIQATSQPLFNIHYGSYLSTQFELAEGVLNRGQVVVGDHQKAILPDTLGVELKGHLDEFIVEEWWQAWLRATETMREEEDEAAQQPLTKINLQFNQVDAWGVLLGNTQLQADWHNLWDVRVESPTLKGDIQYAAQHPVKVQLDYLNLPDQSSSQEANEENGEEGENNESTDPWQNIAPLELPDFDLFVAKLKLGEQGYGRWQINARTNKQGMVFDILSSEISGQQITGQVEWTEQQQQHQTRLNNIKINGTKLERLQQNFNLPPFILSEKVEGTLSGHWPATPMGMRLDEVEAALQLTLKDGHLATDSASAVKAFGVLNINSLSRRLKLDFSDLYKSGLAFDRLTADMALKKGQVTFVEPLTIDGPGGKFIATGQTNLLDKTLDMRVDVVLPVSTNLPLVAILAGLSPPVAASIYVTEKLVGDELSRFTTANYDLKGTWQEPEMTIRGAFNKDSSEKKGFKSRLKGLFGR